MKITRLIFLNSLLSSVGVTVYIVIVATVLQQADKQSPGQFSLWIPVTFLLLFTVSAAVVGGLIFGYPAYQFFNGRKHEGLLQAVTTICLLLVETLVFLGVLFSL